MHARVDASRFVLYFANDHTRWTVRVAHTKVPVGERASSGCAEDCVVYGASGVRVTNVNLVEDLRVPEVHANSTLTPVAFGLFALKMQLYAVYDVCVTDARVRTVCENVYELNATDVDALLIFCSFTPEHACTLTRAYVYSWCPTQPDASFEVCVTHAGTTCVFCITSADDAVQACMHVMQLCAQVVVFDSLHAFNSILASVGCSPFVFDSYGSVVLDLARHLSKDEEFTACAKVSASVRTQTDRDERVQFVERGTHVDNLLSRLAISGYARPVDFFARRDAVAQMAFVCYTQRVQRKRFFVFANACVEKRPADATDQDAFDISTVQVLARSSTSATGSGLMFKPVKDSPVVRNVYAYDFVGAFPTILTTFHATEPLIAEYATYLLNARFSASDEPLRRAFKLMANIFTGHVRQFAPAVGRAMVDACAKHMWQLARTCVDAGFAVVQGHTDSVFVHRPDDASTAVVDVAHEFNRKYALKVRVDMYATALCSLGPSTWFAMVNDAPLLHLGRDHTELTCDWLQRALQAVAVERLRDADVKHYGVDALAAQLVACAFMDVAQWDTVSVFVRTQEHTRMAERTQSVVYALQANLCTVAFPEASLRVVHAISPHGPVLWALDGNLAKPRNTKLYVGWYVQTFISAVRDTMLISPVVTRDFFAAVVTQLKARASSAPNVCCSCLCCSAFIAARTSAYVCASCENNFKQRA